MSRPTTELEFVAALRGLVSDPAARGLMDDAAVIEIGGEALVVTHDMMAQGTHWSAGDDPADVAWKLVAVNLSDLAAKGAEPLGLILGFSLGRSGWDQAFARGLGRACEAMGAPLLGGDTIAGSRVNRVFGITAIGRATHRPVPSRGGAKPGDLLCVTGTLGNAWAGFTLGPDRPSPLANALLRPVPLLAEGRALALHVSAMMDVSDGLLLDARRMAEASGCAVEVQLDAIPLSPDFVTAMGISRDARLRAASWGDDYQLLFAWPGEAAPEGATMVGRFVPGEGVRLSDAGETLPLPDRLGYEHGHKDD